LNSPVDLAVVRRGDKMFAGLLSLALTTLRLPKYDPGARSARMLLDRTSGRSVESEPQTPDPNKQR
jgi:DNA-binding LacI/PurR family transcriptional regulator